MDLYSRRIVAWDLQPHMRESLVLGVLCEAITLRQPPTDLIHHTDRGGQYAGRAYRRVLARAGMRQSMSRADSCYDNAFMESCFGTMKTELELDAYESAPAARREIGGYIRYYNTRRIHSALGYRTPAALEADAVGDRPKPQPLLGPFQAPCEHHPPPYWVVRCSSSLTSYSFPT